MGGRFADDVPVLARKGVELALRTIGHAPDQREARTLSRHMSTLIDNRADNRAPAGRVLVLSPRSWSAQLHYEAVIAHGLRLRGADVRFATCGGGLEICDRANGRKGPPMPCRSCTRYNADTLMAHGFEPVKLADRWDDDFGWPELDALGLDELWRVSHAGLPLGELVEVSVKWFSSTADLRDDPLGALTLRAFLRSARRVADACARLLDETEPDVVMVLSGVFLFEAVMWALCRARGIRVVVYERAYRTGTLTFEHDAVSGYYDYGNAWWRSSPLLTADQEAEIETFLAERRTGRAADQAWSPRSVRFERGTQRTAALFTNVAWDSAVVNRDIGFPGMKEWVVAVVRAFADRPGHRLVVRVHPFETAMAGFETRDPIVATIRQAFPTLPSNVTVLGPDDPTSTYSLIDACDVALTYASITGLEAAVAGKPVIVAGATHYRGKGFTIDVDGEAELLARLDDALRDPSALALDTETARRYAHFFFFQAPVAAPGVTEPVRGLARLTTTDPHDLLPGANPALDRICDAILTGTSFTEM